MAGESFDGLRVWDKLGLSGYLVCLVHLVGLVYLVDLVHLVYPVSLVQPNKQDKPNKPNNGLLTLADCFSILLNLRLL